MSELHLITGGAGCIGSELVGALLRRGEHVIAFDNLSSGRIEHVREYFGDRSFQFVEGDLLNLSDVAVTVPGVDMVWHLAAKTDIKNLNSHYDFEADMQQNFHATWNVLSAMMENGVKRLAFSSSAAVYGDASVLDEDVVQPEPISMYGATKLACEAVIRALALRAGMRAWIFRYCSIVSSKTRNGGNMVVPDFIHKLKADPSRLEIYGDGNQTKPSLLVSECVEAMLHVVSRAKEQVNIYNIGTHDAISVTRQAHLVCEAMGLNGSVKFEYTGGKVGWPGDVASFRMHVDKLAALGWRARYNSEEAVKHAIQGLLASGE